MAKLHEVPTKNEARVRMREWQEPLCDSNLWKGMAKDIRPPWRRYYKETLMIYRSRIHVFMPKDLQRATCFM